MFRTLNLVTMLRNGGGCGVTQGFRSVFSLWTLPNPLVTGHTRVNLISSDATQRQRSLCICNLRKIDRDHRRTRFSGVDVKEIMAEQIDPHDGCTIGNIKVHDWSISGLESCVTVRCGDRFMCVFDMGYPTRPSVKCSHVFISHGHIDHVSGIMQHYARRELYSMKRATYYMPAHLVEPVRMMVQGFAALHGPDQTFTEINIKVINPGDVIELEGHFMVRAFSTVHRVESQGYIIYEVMKKLKPSYQKTDPSEIGSLVRNGVDIFDIHHVPKVAYTGDTTFELFTSPPHKDLLMVELLITEATYIDKEIDKLGRTAEQRARQRGHTHLQEIVDNWKLFENVQNILLVHFSDKYPTKYIKKQMDLIVPQHIKSKLHLGTLMKSILGKTNF